MILLFDLLRLVSLLAMWIVGGLLVLLKYALLPPSWASADAFFGLAASLGCAVIVAAACSLYLDYRAGLLRRGAIRARNDAERRRRAGLTEAQEEI